MVLEKIIIPEIQKVSGNVEKKICAVGITKLLTECPPMMDTEYTKLWQVLHSKILGDCSCLSLWLQHQPGSLSQGSENWVLISASPLATIGSKTWPVDPLGLRWSCFLINFSGSGRRNSWTPWESGKGPCSWWVLRQFYDRCPSELASVSREGEEAKRRSYVLVLSVRQA